MTPLVMHPVRTMPAPPSNPSLPHAELAWGQVLARDPAADGQFVYAVRTTGIFCRPTCPSRRPLRRNVVFYATPQQASVAGYRPCQRCHPQLAEPVSAVRRAALVLAAQLQQQLAADGDMRIGTAARRGGVDRVRAVRGFQQALGISPSELARAMRFARLRKELGGEKKITVTDALYAAGFGSSSRMYEQSTAWLGMQPRSFRAGGAGEQIGYTTAACALGRVLVAATGRGICWVALGEQDALLLQDLQRAFPRAAIQPGATSEAANGWLQRAVAYVASQLTEHPGAAEFPLDVRATAFQHRVWKALQQIPRGETRSYGQVAAALGMPRAARAVGAAIGSNPVALVVPCHRVVGSKGELTGYRWGVEKKARLLAAERAPQRQTFSTE
ncbi:MAG: methylated-DNA--[protein]-cysteine S-methyltransferase [Acidobacteriota bacterium]|nr:methylated-DNA--[protein]-cysteine S-methyltransferase [Acidobacteriota bacterium]